MKAPKNLRTTINQRNVIGAQPPGTTLFGALHGMPVLQTETGELWAITPRNHPAHGSLLRVTRRFPSLASSPRLRGSY